MQTVSSKDGSIRSVATSAIAITTGITANLFLLANLVKDDHEPSNKIQLLILTAALLGVSATVFFNRRPYFFNLTRPIAIDASKLDVEHSDQDEVRITIPHL